MPSERAILHTGALEVRGHLSRDALRQKQGVSVCRARHSEWVHPAKIFGDGDLNRGTAEANARLIASAPDLLVALQRCVEELEQWLDVTTADLAWEPTVSAINAAKAAINKATGETK